MPDSVSLQPEEYNEVVRTGLRRAGLSVELEPNTIVTVVAPTNENRYSCEFYKIYKTIVLFL